MRAGAISACRSLPRPAGNNSLEGSLGTELASKVGELESRMELARNSLSQQLAELKTSVTRETAAKCKRCDR